MIETEPFRCPYAHLTRSTRHHTAVLLVHRAPIMEAEPFPCSAKNSLRTTVKPWHELAGRDGADARLHSGHGRRGVGRDDVRSRQGVQPRRKGEEPGTPDTAAVTAQGVQNSPGRRRGSYQVSLRSMCCQPLSLSVLDGDY